MKKQSKIRLDYYHSNYKNASLSQNKNPRQYYNHIINKKRKMFFLIFLFLLCLVVNFYFLFFSSYFDIQNFEISIRQIAKQNISQEKIKKIASDQFEQKRFFFFNQKNLFVFNKKTLQNNLNQIYNLNKLKIHKEFKNPLWIPTIKINLEEKISALIWITSNNKCYFLDETGIVLKEIKIITPTLSDASIEINQSELQHLNIKDNKYCKPENLVEKFKKIPIIYNEDDKKIEIKKTITNKKLIQSILFLYKTLPIKTKIEISYFKIPVLKKMTPQLTDEKEIEKNKNEKENKKTIPQKPIISSSNLEEEYIQLEKTEIRVVTKDGFEIYFDIFFSDLDQQINTLRKILDQEIKDKISSLEYIDLRFGNRVYYKIKE
jgi:cell division septal protein FtsQ